MEKFQEAREKSKLYIKAADHMASVTYNMVQDSKVLVAAMENTFLALTHAMGSVLHYEKLFKRIPAFQDNFESKFRVFSQKSSRRYGINKEYLRIMQEIKEMLIEQGKGGKDYLNSELSPAQVKEYIAKAKQFVSEAEKIVSKNERIFK